MLLCSFIKKKKIRKALFDFLLTSHSSEAEQPSVAGLGPNPNPSSRGQEVPFPCGEADLGLRAPSEVTTHFWKPGGGLPPLWTRNPTPAKWAIVSPASPQVARAGGHEAPWSRHKEYGLRMRLGSLEAWGAGRELWAEKRPREGRRDSPGVGSEGRVRTRPDSVQECVPSDVSSLKPESDRRVTLTPHPEPNSGTEGDSEPHPEAKASPVRRTWQAS